VHERSLSATNIDATGFTGLLIGFDEDPTPSFDIFTRRVIIVVRDHGVLPAIVWRSSAATCGDSIPFE